MKTEAGNAEEKPMRQSCLDADSIRYWNEGNFKTQYILELIQKARNG